MKIYLHEITENETELDFTQEELWVRNAVARVDEEGTSPSIPSVSQPKARPVNVCFKLRRVDDVIVTSGKADTYVRLLCSRCANIFQLQTKPRFAALFCTDPVMAGVGHIGKEGKPAGQNRGFARHAHDTALDTTDSDETSNLDITYLCEDFIDLADILTEQLQLQIPFQPLCRDDCKGMCLNCGADQNIGKCACAKLVNSSPFTALKNIKIT